MARYKKYCYDQGKFLSVHFHKQIVEGTFEYTLSYLIDNEVDLTPFDKEPDAMLSHKIDRMCKLFSDISENLPSEYAKHLQLRGTKETPITCSILRFDDLYVVNQYLSSRSSRKCPLYLAKGRKAAWPIAFREEFELLWKDADDLLDKYVAS